MKTTLLAAAALTALLTQSAFGQQTPAAPTDPRAQQTPSAAELDKQYARLQEQMKQMQDQMAKLAQTQDPQERQRLLQQHWASMQTAMTAMHSAWGGMMGPGCCAATAPPQGGHMMNGPMMGGHMMMWGDYRNLTPEQLRERQYMMDRWMPMQQMMMDHMMQHQYWMQPQPVPPTPAKK